MSGNRKGREAAREAAAALRAAGLRVVLALRDGEGPDVDAFVECGPGRWVTLQIRRQEDPRPRRWARDHVGPGRALMYRRNRERWTIGLYVAGLGGTWCDVETFAGYALGGVLA